VVSCWRAAWISARFFYVGGEVGARQQHGGVDELFGQLLKLLAPLNGLGQRIGLLRGNMAGEVAATFPDLVFEVRPPVLPGVPGRGPRLSLKRTVFHALDLLHLLKDLLAFVKD